MVASVYLRTNGDPISAVRQCYEELQVQLTAPVSIIGLGVTGSGRQIAGLHALTNAVINEISAHATAAVYFDPNVETILEIGGQDAKYTYITNKVPSDYAMNEACSAGTGSFLEESAKETLGVSTYEIAARALRGAHPTNFSDQCAAFISSDIKTAVQEGIETDDILAGLVYSICQNYANRVKGNRPIGQKVYMQGGVCYNRAVPIAMAALTGKEIIVPPEPGLMGAFGVALEVKERQRLGLLQEEIFELGELAQREVSDGRTFVCSGGNDGCDRKCSIRMIGVNGRYYPFGGACNRYANIHQASDMVQTPDTSHQTPVGSDSECSRSSSNSPKNCRGGSQTRPQELPLDLVAFRERLVFDHFASRENLKHPGRLSVGINKSLLTNTLYPLYYHFFTELGFDVLLPNDKSPEGVERRAAPFCYPVEISHGHLYQLLSMQPDILFLPHVKGMPGEESDGERITCPFVQGEPYYLQSTFDDLLQGKMVLAPVLDLANGLQSAEKPFLSMAERLGIDKGQAQRAFATAVKQQSDCLQEMQRLGEETLKQLAKNDQQMTVVVFGRPYNALTTDANMGIPHKLASRGVRIMPLDFLPVASRLAESSMYWATGQVILKAAELVAEHPQLFGLYITNFSCGPDSFLLSFFRHKMGDKPSLTLELDSHTADAGIDTRIEAFLDIVASFRMLCGHQKQTKAGNLPKVFVDNGHAVVHTVNGNAYPLIHPRVKVLIPPLGEWPNRVLAASFQAVGINAEALPAPGDQELKRGKAYASCKECLPLMLTVGGLLNYLDRHPETSEQELVYFMPKTNGPCRFGQYHVLIEQILERLG
ncbi:MAG: acyl-CoA dehydratase activase-related protein, partial [Bacillota bacterium]